jgi:FMNH2-dependent dimethyl sulfone monooxygenase
LLRLQQPRRLCGQCSALAGWHARCKACPYNMALQFGTWSPVCGSWLRIVAAEHARVDPARLIAFAQQADRLRYDLHYVPEHYLNAVHGPQHDVADAWVISAAAAATTQRIRIVTAVQPGFKLPGVVAKMAATIAALRPNAFGLSVLAGWWQLEVETHGDRWLPHAERYARTGEFLDVIRGFWSEPSFSYEGRYFRIADGVLEAKPRPVPPVIVAGESQAAFELAARCADYLFLNGGDLAHVAAQVQRAKTLAREKFGRPLKVALSAFGLVRDSDAEAHAAIAAWSARVDNATVNYFRRHMDGAVVAHNRGSAADQIEANLGLTSGLIGSPSSILQRLAALEAVGVDAVLLKFEPSESEAERFAVDVMQPYRRRVL